MNIVCANADAATQVSGVLSYYAVSHQVSWQQPVARGQTAWIVISAALDPASEAAIRHEIDSIAGATVQE